MSRWLLALALSAVALGAAAWLFVSIGEMHDRLARHSGTLALVFLAIVGAVAVASAAAAARLVGVLGRPDPRPIKPPEDVIRAAEVQAQEAEGVITKVRDESVRADLNAELATLRVDRERRRFQVVVFGTGSAG